MTCENGGLHICYNDTLQCEQGVSTAEPEALAVFPHGKKKPFWTFLCIERRVVWALWQLQFSLGKSIFIHNRPTILLWKLWERLLRICKAVSILAGKWVKAILVLHLGKDRFWSTEIKKTPAREVLGNVAHQLVKTNLHKTMDQSLKLFQSSHSIIKVLQAYFTAYRFCADPDLAVVIGSWLTMRHVWGHSEIMTVGGPATFNYYHSEEGFSHHTTISQTYRLHNLSIIYLVYLRSHNWMPSLLL